VAKAHGIGMQTLADLTNLDRAGLYRALSEQGNPSFANLREILKALGFEISLSAIEKTG
jgi:probable addiction module antidote protein